MIFNILINLAIISVIVVIGVTWWYFSAEQKLKRELRRIPVSPIRGVREGQRARITGVVRAAGEPLVSPVSGRPCVYVAITVEEQQALAVKTSWKRIHHEASCVAFLVEDATGRALVDASDARVAITIDRTESSLRSDGQTVTYHAFFESRGLRIPASDEHRSFRFHEAIIAIGETVSILGEGIREPDPDASPTDAYRGDAPTRLRLSSSKKHPLVITDDASSLGNDVAATPPRPSRSEDRPARDPRF